MPASPLSMKLASSLEKLDVVLSVTMQKLDVRDQEMDDWLASVRKRVLPRLKGEIPLIVGLCGGGNAGKSTLFNALAGKDASCIGPRAGLTRRALLAIPRSMFMGRRRLLEELFHPFGGIPEPLPEDDSGTLMDEPGPPLYVLTDSGLPDAILVDMPDMDVAANDGGYANRENAEKVLTACDLLVFMASNPTYNNRDIAQFMRKTASGTGLRGSILLYRFPNPFSETGHVDDVFTTMTRHLYPHTANPPVWGRLVMVDDAAVREGEPPCLVRFEDIPAGERPKAGRGVDELRRMISGLDRLTLNYGDTVATIENGLERVASVSSNLAHELDEIERLYNALKYRGLYAARTSFSAFPMHEFSQLVSQIWKDQQNVAVKTGRFLGDAIRWPFKACKKQIDKLRGVAPAAAETDDAKSNVDAFLRQVAKLYAELQEEYLYIPKVEKGMSAVSDGIASGQLDDTLPKIKVPMPRQYKTCLDGISGDGFFTTIESDLARVWEDAIRLPPNADAILRPIIEKAREKMSSWEVIKEIGSSAIDMALPVVAVGYVFMTGDIGTGTLISLSDLSAIVAVPLLLGNEQVTDGWVKDSLTEVVKYWQEKQTPLLVEAIETYLTGSFLKKGEDILRNNGESVRILGGSLDDAAHTFSAWTRESDHERSR